MSARVARWLLLCACAQVAPGCRERSPVPKGRADAGAQAPVDAAGPAGAASSAGTAAGSERSRPRPAVRPAGRCFPADSAVAPPRALQALLDRSAQLFDEAVAPADAPAGTDTAGPRAALLTASLVCADEALRAFPRSVEALESRALALMERNQTDDLSGARDALTLALALEPSDPHTLASAAELYVRFLDASDDHSNIGLEYARRGSRLCEQRIGELRKRVRPARARGTGAGAAAGGAADALRDTRLLGARLALLEGQALGDLGRAEESLARLEAAIALDDQAGGPGAGRVGTDARYERALALFDLCRFSDARRGFEAVIAARQQPAPPTAPANPDGRRPVPAPSAPSPDRAPDHTQSPARDPRPVSAPGNTAWAQHYLGLTLEMLGEAAAAERALAESERLAPADFPKPLAVTPAEFRALVDKEVAALPAELRRDLAQVTLETADLPEIADLIADVAAGHPPLSPTILGLFRGLPLPEVSPAAAKSPQRPGAPVAPVACPPGGAAAGANGADGTDEPRSIVLYRKNLLRAVRTREDLVTEIRTTLLHELGHLRGEDDDTLRDRGLE